jgi:hypothetical protein
MPNENPQQPDSDQVLEDFENLISFARDYFTGDFPNPARIACLTSDEIERATKSNRLPPDRLREHVFGCSNCFQQYHQMLTARQKDRIALLSAWQQFLVAVRQPRFAVATVVLILIVFSVAVIYVHRGKQQGSVVARDADTASPTEAVTELPRDLSSQGASSSVEIHFDSYHLRGDENTGEASTEASRGKTEFVITLPRGSPVGEYSVAVVDAFGSIAKKTVAQSHDGKMLIAEIDLAKLPQRKYRLCVSRPSESPNCRLISLK